MIAKCVLFTLLLFLKSCSPPILRAQTDYLTERSLASFYVNTPDPLSANPPLGQRLFIDWTLPKNWRHLPDKELIVTIRFRNGEEAVLRVPLTRWRGSWVWYLLNEEYCEKRGILTYKIALLGGGSLLTEWYHHVWEERIVLEEE